MTQSFNVLDPKEDIHRSYLLEASAGTGKTFAIENIVVRKLTEGEVPLKFEQMVIVTFTKAAVADLKNRIYKNIKAHYSHSQDPRLDEALQMFHEASIFTIHGFCGRMLQEGGIEGGALLQSVGNLSSSLYKRIVTDFIQVTFNSNSYSMRQIEKLKGNSSIEKLISLLISWVKKGIPSICLPSLAEQKHTLAKLWNQCGNTSLDTIQAVVPHYNKLKGAEALLKTPIAHTDFEALLELTEHVLAKITPDNLKARAKNPPTLPDAIYRFRETALCYISKSHLFADLVEKCRQHVNRYCENEDLTPFDLLLSKMDTACSNPNFRKNIRQKYKLAIVDEFQDTDPVQWSIFKSLFVGEGQLILVGDPKQSIYGFRQADIYTYKSAASTLGESARRSLDTNYRSTPALVDALNSLFNAQYTPGWIPLPRLNSTIHYEPVKAGRTHVENGSLTLQIASSEEELLKAIANTIIRKQYPLNTTAILINDRHQASRMAKILQQAHIPFVIQNRELLTQTEAWNDWITILTAILHPKNRSFIKCALGTTFIGFSHLELRALEENDQLPFFMDKFVLLKTGWLDKGLAYVTEKLPAILCTSPSETLHEHLLTREGGALYLHHFTQIQDIFLEEEATERLSPQELMTRAKNLQELGSDEDSRLLSIQDIVQEGIRILTIHSSKGLEFETVFTPGLTQSKSFKDELVPHIDLQTPVLSPFNSLQDPKVLSHLEELDAEKMRQFYVALTRAKQNLYIPYILPAKAKYKLGEASPVQLFFARMGRPLHTSSQELYDTIHNLSTEDIKQLLPQHPAIFIEQIPPEPLSAYSSHKQQRSLTCPSTPSIPGRSISIDSFTSLTQSQPRVPFAKLEAKEDPIPAGAETGIIFHKIFECIDFSSPNTFPYLAGTQLEPWHVEIEHLVSAAVTFRFPENFTLADIPKEHQFREMEFLYPSPSGYIKGIIDLIFCFEDKIHIIDWKSNLLPTYAETSLKEAMDQHHYFLQAQLYKEAARRYFGDLPIVIDYFFVRGRVSYRIEEHHVG